MALRENLIPTTIVDKNGRVTTVHKKQDTSKVSSSLLAAPSLGKAVDKSALREEVISSLVDTWETSRYDEDRRDILRNNLRKYSDELLEMLISDADSSNPTAYMKNSASNGYPETELREQLCFLPILPHQNSYYISRRLILGLHHYPEFFSSEDFSLASDEVKSQCKALMVVTDALLSSPSAEEIVDTENAFVLQDKKLVEFVINNSDKIELMTDFIRERVDSGATRFDLDLLSEMFQSDAPAMNQGML